ncbi:MAG: phage terminase large subunit family protein [Flavobacteriales bacterium]|nr:phage terminase large subunit family protein [Flavobacteriales bacterium]
MFASAGEIRREVAALARPPVRMQVSEAASRYLKVQTPGGGVAPWDPSLTPYMIEPMNMLTSRLHESVIFAGPARTGKTLALIDGFIGYMVTCDPSDMLVTQISQEKAKDYSKLRVNRMHRNSPEIGKHLSTNKQDDNVFEKYYKAGNVLKIGWPTVKQLSSSDYKYVLLTDYDRMPENVDHEGSPFSLGQKRTQTFLSRGMTAAESSPGYEIIDPNWKARSPHEAPPTRGILSLYNLGDRRRWYWPCPHCGTYFMPLSGIDAFSFNINKDLFGATETEITGVVGLIATCCGQVIDEKEKSRMNAKGVWVQEGCHIEQDSDAIEIVGEPRKTKVASFWMPGASAAYQTWTSIVQRYLNALREYDLTGSEETLKATTNVDQGAPYLPRRLMSETSVADLEKRAEDLPKRAVPENARFLLASIDVQGSRFVVQVIAYGVGYENWLIDRFDIHSSKRMRDSEALPLDPAGYIEDWDLIIDKVINRSYPLADGSNRTMAIFCTACDSGGKAGVTDRAYSFWRKLRKKGLHNRFVLVKGERPSPNSHKPTVSKSYPDNSNRSDRKARARGDVPVWLLNTTLLKDSVASDMKREEAGPRYMHYPDWLGLWFYEELIAEVRSEKGWDNPRRVRNESFDLYAYAKGLLHALLVENKLKEINWTSPPAWAAEWNNNNQINLVINAVTKTKKQNNNAPVDVGGFINVQDDWFK